MTWRYLCVGQIHLTKLLNLIGKTEDIFEQLKISVVFCLKKNKFAKLHVKTESRVELK